MIANCDFYYYHYLSEFFMDPINKMTMTLQKRNNWTPALRHFEKQFLNAIKSLNTFNIVDMKMCSKCWSVRKVLLKIRAIMCSFQIFTGTPYRVSNKRKYKLQTPDKISTISGFWKSESLNNEWVSYSEASEANFVDVNTTWGFFTGFSSINANSAFL